MSSFRCVCSSEKKPPCAAGRGERLPRFAEYRVHGGVAQHGAPVGNAAGRLFGRPAGLGGGGQRGAFVALDRGGQLLDSVYAFFARVPPGDECGAGARRSGYAVHYALVAVRAEEVAVGGAQAGEHRHERAEPLAALAGAGLVPRRFARGLRVRLEEELRAQQARLDRPVRLRPGANPVTEYDGEIVTARLLGARAESDYTEATLSTAGDPASLYIGRADGTDIIRYHTSNIYGNREIVSEVSQLDRKEGYIDFESPFIHPEAGTLPKLLLSPVQRQDLVSRKAALRAEKNLRIDTLTTFMTRRKDLLLESVDHRRYHLDDYNRFPSVREVLVEIIPELSLRRVKDVWQLQLVVSDAVQSRFDRTGSILVMMDGVVLSDLDLLLGFDAMLLEDVDIYLQSFVCGKVAYHGLVNFITKKNYVTALHFPANVRVVDFQGVAYPVAYNGAVPEGEGQDLRQLLYWHPVLNLDAGSDYRIEIHTPGYAGRFKAVAEGFTEDGKPVYQEFAFEVE